MSEYRRAFQPGGCYFFTVVTHERRPLLTEEYALERLRKAFRRIMQNRPFAMDASPTVSHNYQGMQCKAKSGEKAEFTRSK